MTCSCGAAVESGLGRMCQRCLEKWSHEALLQHQLQILPKVLALEPDYELRLVRFPRSPEPHIELFGDPLHAYCGMRIDGPGRKRFYQPYNLAVSGNLCAPCRSALRRLTEQISQDSSVSTFREKKA